MFLARAKRVVGLEMDHGELRAVELQRGRNGLQYVSAGRISLPLTAIAEGLILETRTVAETLSKFWAEQGFKSRDVVLGVSNKDVLIRFTEFPVVPASKLGAMIRYHTRDLIPISLEDGIMDYAVLGPASGEQQEMQEILLVATQRPMIESFLEVLNAAHLKARDINVVPLVLQNLLPPAEAKGAVAILDLANGSSNILVTMDGKPRLARRLTSNLQDLAPRLYCTLDEVVERSGAAPNEIFPDAFVDWGETLVGEIRSSINYYQSQEDAMPVEKLLLSGRGASITGFAAQLQEIFAVPVVLANPLNFLDGKSPASSIAEQQAVDCAVAFALAMNGLE